MYQFFPNDQREGVASRNSRPNRPWVIPKGKTLAALPLEIQRVEKALKLDPIFDHVEKQLKNLKRKRETGDLDGFKDERNHDGIHFFNGVGISKEDERRDEKRVYNLESLSESRMWMKDVLAPDFSSEEDDDDDVINSDHWTEEKKDQYVMRLLKEHAYVRRCKRKFRKFSSPDQQKFMFYGSGVVMEADQFSESLDVESLSTPSVKSEKPKKAQKAFDSKEKPPIRGMTKIKVEDDVDLNEDIAVQNFNSDVDSDDDDEEEEEVHTSTPSYTPTSLSKRQQVILNNAIASSSNEAAPKSSDLKQKAKPKKPVNAEQMAAKRKKVWVAIAKKDIPRMHKHKSTLRKDNLAGLRKVAKECQRECRKVALASQKQSKEAGTRARRLAKEMQAYWKRFEKVEKEHRKKAEKEALEQKKMDMELKEMLRQQRKLNFLITRTEIYAHFMAGKLSGGGTNPVLDGSEGRCEEILRRFDEDKLPNNNNHRFNKKLDDDDYDSQQMKDLVMSNVKTAIEAQRNLVKEFDSSSKPPVLNLPKDQDVLGSAFSDPSITKVGEWKQPAIFKGTLKSYQLKGMNWIANLYEHGINGILADEMGLGKTVQSVAFLAHLAEEQGIWGPFLVVAPASTLHNWLQEMTKFVPEFKVIPYWGTTQDRKVLRKFWNKGINKHDIPTKESSFHVVITSYQMVVQDAKYFQQINWHYMVLDEAQAIKSSNSSRWKSLLVFKCRNRLLLTGTPIQNSMAELWALLHFIMPTLFDSHEEFNEWFSKDIESHVERQSCLDANQLSRLHIILKPFMLRRVKKDVENELSDKIEVQVCCPLTLRQRLLYKAIKNKISIADLLQSSSLSVSVTNSLMNIVMQLRKVCNHPELFERRDLKAPCFVQLEPYYLPKLVYREGWRDRLSPDRIHALERLKLFDHHSIHRSIFHDVTEDRKASSSFSFTRFIDLSVSELCSVQKDGLFRWLHHLDCLKSKQLLHYQRHTGENVPKKRSLYSMLILDVSSPTSPQSVEASSVLRDLCFVRPVDDVYALCDHAVHFTRETFEHRKMRLRKKMRGGCGGRTGVAEVGIDKFDPTNPDNGFDPDSNFSSLIDEDSNSQQKLVDDQENSSSTDPFVDPPRRPPVTRCLVPTSVPSFLLCLTPKVVCRGTRDYYTCDRSSEWSRRRDYDQAHNRIAMDCLNYGSPEIRVALENWKLQTSFSMVPTVGGFVGSAPRSMGYSGILLPSKEMLVTDAGKLTVLDGLLTKLKSENHRVLIYSQMTKMIDILEEFLWHRRHTYMRLDGSSKISERRDMVADFQTKSDIFIFLLSTRAGGLGINLTAADTVIFYDSDWNPTVDQQAMDRAHRLGQTKQVTVYRLVCEGTIEERILQRAKEKSEIQRMVISGNDFTPDILKPKEVVTLLLDDDEMAKRVCQKQEQRRARDELRRDLGFVDSRKRPKSKSGRGPGRPPKKLCLENREALPQGPTSVLGVSSESPASVGALASSFAPGKLEHNHRSLLSEGLMDDDTNSTAMFSDADHKATPTVADFQQIEVPRKRGRPKGSTSANTSNNSHNNSHNNNNSSSNNSNNNSSSGSVHSRPRGRGSIQKSLNAAEAAALSAAKQAALAVHGYNYSAKKPSPAST